MPPFAFNCDIATPMLRRGDAVLAVDLFLDVLVRSDGVTHEAHDQPQFDDAIRRGWVSEREAAGARGGLAELTDLIKPAAWWRSLPRPIPSPLSARRWRRPCTRCR